MPIRFGRYDPLIDLDADPAAHADDHRLAIDRFKPGIEVLQDGAAAVYGTDAGRICVAAVNSGSVEYVANAIAAVR